MNLYINGVLVKNFVNEFPKISEKSEIACLQFCENFIGKMQSALVFNHPIGKW